MASKSPWTGPPLPKWAVATLSALLGVVVFLVGTYGFYAIAYADNIVPGTTVGPVAVGGLTTSAAEGLLLAEIRRYEQAPIGLTIDGTPVTFRPSDIAASYDAGASAQAAYDLGRHGTLWANVVAQVSALVQPNRIDLVMDYQAESLDRFLATQSERFDEPEQNVGVVLKGGQVSLTPEQAGRRFNQADLKDALAESLATITPSPELRFALEPVQPQVSQVDVEPLLSQIRQVVREPLSLTYGELSFTVTREQLASWLGFAPAGTLATGGPDGFLERSRTARLEFDQTKIVAYTKTLAAEVAQEPVDAKLTIKDGRASVFQASRDGRALDESATEVAILEALENRRQADATTAASPSADRFPAVTLSVSVTKPAVTSSTIEDLGIKELIGTGTTDFSGSPSNRIHNIGNGTRFLNGLLVKPGEEFSTVGALGNVEASTGYLPELVIKENRTIPEYGGGLCQVSTTLFRAILDASLKVTARRNHSYRVSYYERGIGPGLDATVYLPQPDLKFRNDTPGWILIQGSVSGNSLTFELYGTSDGRETTIDGPHVLSRTSPPPDVYEQTDQLAPGEVKQIEKPHEGAKTTATYVVTRGGQELFRQTFDSSYKALPARYLEGPKQVNEAAPAPTETPTSSQ